MTSEFPNQHGGLENKFRRLPSLTPELENQILTVIANDGSSIPLQAARDGNLFNTHLPVLAEVTGTSGIGKSTNINNLSAQLNNLGVKTRTVEERVPFFDKGFTGTPRRETFNLAMPIITLIQAVRARENYDVLIFDRFFYNIIPFIETETVLSSINTLKRSSESRNPFLYKFIDDTAGKFTDALIIVTPEINNVEKFTGTSRTRKPEYLRQLANSFIMLPEIIAETRKRSKKEKKPLVIGKITVNSKKEDYSSIFAETIGTICKLYTK